MTAVPNGGENRFLKIFSEFVLPPFGIPEDRMRIVRRSFGIAGRSVGGRTESRQDRGRIVFGRSRIIRRSRKNTHRKSFDLNSLTNERGQGGVSNGRFQWRQVPILTGLTLPQPFRSFFGRYSSTFFPAAIRTLLPLSAHPIQYASNLDRIVATDR
jgi:hypothetical protein